jgi:5-methyltetrahydrofolate--homocysteine methyltransferase
MSTQKKILKDLNNAVIEGDVEKTAKIVKQALKKINPLIIVEDGLAKGVRIVGAKFAKGDYFLPEMVMGANAMQKGVEILAPLMAKGKMERKSIGKYLLGTVQGDIHDIGKNIVKAMLLAAGFEVNDLGVDVPNKNFVKKTNELKPDILGLSSLMTMTRPRQREVISEIRQNKIKVKTMIGGAVTSQDWAEKIGADAYAPDAVESVKISKKMISKK